MFGMGDPSLTSGSRELPRRVIHFGVKGGEHLGARLAHHLMADTVVPCWCRRRQKRLSWSQDRGATCGLKAVYSLRLPYDSLGKLRSKKRVNAMIV